MRHIFRRVVHFFRHIDNKKEDSQQLPSSVSIPAYQTQQTSIEPQFVVLYCQYQRQLRQVWQDSLYLCVTRSIAECAVLGKKKRDSIVLSPPQVTTPILGDNRIFGFRFINDKFLHSDIQCVLQTSKNVRPRHKITLLNTLDSHRRNTRLSRQLVYRFAAPQSPVAQRNSQIFLVWHSNLHMVMRCLLSTIPCSHNNTYNFILLVYYNLLDFMLLACYNAIREQKKNAGNCQRLNSKAIGILLTDWTPGSSIPQVLILFIIANAYKFSKLFACLLCKSVSTRIEVCS
jgi:hypothetical protein